MEKIINIAWISPFPPVKSGISIYSEVLVNHINFNYKNINIEKISIQRNGLMKSIYDCDINNYDKLIYSLGNHPFHSKIYELLVKHPGIVFIHDINIHDLIYYLTQENKKKYINYLLNENNIKEKDIYILLKNYDRNIFKKYDLIKETILRNYAFIVHTEQIQNKIEKIKKTNILRINHISNWYKYKKLDLTKNRIKIGIFGYVSKSKKIEEFLNVFTEFIKNSKKKYEIIIVGENADIKIENIIKRNDIKNYIKIFKNVNDEKFLTLMKECDIGVNIKDPYYGEMSSNLIKFMGFGIPVLINDNAFLDIPENTVYKINMNNFDNNVMEFLKLIDNNEKILYNINIHSFNFIKENYDIKKNTEKIVEFIINSKKENISNIKRYSILEIKKYLSKENIIKGICRRIL